MTFKDILINQPFNISKENIAQRGTLYIICANYNSLFRFLFYDLLSQFNLKLRTNNFKPQIKFLKYKVYINEFLKSFAYLLPEIRI